MKNIVFIGMPSVGKSTIGLVVAKRMGYQFIDTDLLIQEEEGCLLKDIIVRDGIEGFLKVEDRINAGLDVKRSIIAPGGSIIYCKNAMEHYRKIATIVYLQASFETINERVGDPKKRGVVLKPGQTLRDLYDERVPIFASYADITVCQDQMGMDESIEAVLKVLQ